MTPFAGAGAVHVRDTDVGVTDAAVMPIGAAGAAKQRALLNILYSIIVLIYGYEYTRKTPFTRPLSQIN